jgi:hypothetical protein
VVRKRRRKKLPVPERQPLVRPVQPNEVSSMDFVFDELANGRRVKTLTVVDDCSKEVVQIAVDTSIPALYVTRVLDQVKAERGLPKVIRTDNGPEFAGRTMQTWAARNGVELRFIQPGKPVQNAYIESFNSRFRDECLSQHWFASLSHMRSVIDNWREDYNHHRPHSTLGYVPPAVFAARCRQHAGGSAPNPASTTTIRSPGVPIEVLRNPGAAQTAEGIARWRATGPGWRTRMAERLAKAPVPRAKSETQLFAQPDAPRHDTLAARRCFPLSASRPGRNAAARRSAQALTIAQLRWTTNEASGSQTYQ